MEYRNRVFEENFLYVENALNQYDKIDTMRGVYCESRPFRKTKDNTNNTVPVSEPAESLSVKPTVIERMRKAIQSIIEAAKKMMNKIREMFEKIFMSAEEKALFKKYEEECRSNPALKNVKITVGDWRKTMTAYDTAIKEAEKERDEPVSKKKNRRIERETPNKNKDVDNERKEADRLEERDRKTKLKEAQKDRDLIIKKAKIESRRPPAPINMYSNSDMPSKHKRGAAAGGRGSDILGKLTKTLAILAVPVALGAAVVGVKHMKEESGKIDQTLKKNADTMGTIDQDLSGGGDKTKEDIDEAQSKGLFGNMVNKLSFDKAKAANDYHKTTFASVKSVLKGEAGPEDVANLLKSGGKTIKNSKVGEGVSKHIGHGLVGAGAVLDFKNKVDKSLGRDISGKKEKKEKDESSGKNRFGFNKKKKDNAEDSVENKPEDTVEENI